MKHNILLFLLWLVTSLPLIAQKLYVPRNVSAAINKGSRTENGLPGQNYWQNQGKYDLNIQLDPKTGTIRGEEKITYTNNSPDTLDKLVFNFVNNVHKQGVFRNTIPDEDFITQGLHISELIIDGESYNIDGKEWGTVAAIQLKKAVNPKREVYVLLHWDYPLSKKSDREGRIDSTTFFVAYAYPRIAVYDDYNGWDMLQHNGQVEFYNDFNDYDLKVSVPNNYVVWATGELQNPNEVLQAPIVERLKQSMQREEIVKIASRQEMASGKVTKQNNWNQWRFTAQHIPDVAFAVSNHYEWDASSTVVDPKTTRRASTQAAYGPDAEDYPNSVKWNNYTLNWYSTIWPAIPYPYSKMTVFQGFSAMEYPMMVNDISISDPHNAMRVQNHEIAHTYFPFYMGINETRYAFMDEGWATISEYMIGKSLYGKEKADSIFKAYRVKDYIKDPSAEQDQPIISQSSQVSGSAYRTNAYSKSSLALLALQDLLGQEAFKSAFQKYVEIWNGKHPTPWDYFYCINTATEQSLNWFWNNWYFSNNYIDLKVKDIKGNSTTISNTGGFAIPFDVVIHYTDGSQSKKHYTPEVWQSNQTEITLPINSGKEVAAVELDNGVFMDATPNDNFQQIKIVIAAQRSRDDE